MTADSGRLSVTLIGPDGARSARVRTLLNRAGMRPVVQHRTPKDMATLASAAAHVVILEVGQDEVPAAGVVAATRSTFPTAALIALWQQSRHEYARRMLRLGFDGVIFEDQLETTLAATVRAVCAGVICVPRVLRTEMKRENLSGRERQILGLVVGGSTNAEIATRLFLAESTVKSHLSSAYEKLGVSSRQDAAALILDPEVGLDRGILAISAA